MVEEDPESEGLGELIAHSGFVQSLAAHLLARTDGAEDVAQETWMAAMQSRRAGELSGRSLKAWLAQVVRRKAFRLRTRERSRGLREERYGQELAERGGEGSPESHSLRAETIQRVTAAVLALKEPYQQTVLLRFYENLADQDIAKRMGVPVATVRSRLQRAKAQLRSQLRAEFDGSEARWQAALLPLLQDPPPAWVSTFPAITTVGGLAMTAKIKIALVGLAALGALTWYSLVQPAGTRLDAQAGIQAEGSSMVDLGAPAASEVVEVGERSVRREGTGGTEQAQPQEDPGVSVASGLFGTVLYKGRPLEGVQVTPYGVSVHRLKHFATGEDVVGHVRPIDREVRAQQSGYSSHTAIPADREVDAPLPEDLRSFSPIRDLAPVQTDSRGRFAFPQVPDRPFVLRFTDADQGLALLSGPFLPPNEPSWEVGPFEMQLASQIEGHLQFDHALSLQGHTVRMRGLPGFASTSDADGRFAFRQVPPGEFLVSIDVGPGVYRPEWGQSFFLRVGPGAQRSVTLSSRSKPCSLLTVGVTHNDAPCGGGTLTLQERGSDRTVSIKLDELGRGQGTVPRDLPHLPYLRRPGSPDSSLIGEDLVIRNEREEIQLQVQTGGIHLRLPHSALPPMETTILSVRTRVPWANAVRFDRILGPDGTGVPLDAAGLASLRVPAWMPLQPCLQNEAGAWIHIDTHEVMFPAGEASFEMVWDEAAGKLSLSGHDPQLRQSTSERTPPYRLSVEWRNPRTQELERTHRRVSLLRVVAQPEEDSAFEIEGLPTGPLDVWIRLQRKGSAWQDVHTWKRTVTVHPAGEREEILLSR